MRYDDDEIDGALSRLPAWEPPTGFSRRVAARSGLATPELYDGFDPVETLTHGALVGTTFYVVAHLLAALPIDRLLNRPVTLALVCLAWSALVATWSTRRIRILSW